MSWHYLAGYDTCPRGIGWVIVQDIITVTWLTVIRLCVQEKACMLKCHCAHYSASVSCLLCIVIKVRCGADTVKPEGTVLAAYISTT